ncbi:MAG: helix-turn-helix transcriptional regulator [Saccharothrix sp.]|nr:helix-turn-helix transcriptional regulator [Saccharothrix sp.]
MLGRTYEGQNCSAARTLELMGERWSFLIIRDAVFSGVTRFREFQRRLGVAPNILKNRLDGFVADGLMEKHAYANSDRTQEYVLTDKGRDLRPVLIALSAWGDRWLAPDGPPVIYTHAECGGDLDQLTRCTACGEEHHNLATATRPGPGATRKPAALSSTTDAQAG